MRFRALLLTNHIIEFKVAISYGLSTVNGMLTSIQPMAGREEEEEAAVLVQQLEVSLQLSSWWH